MKKRWYVWAACGLLAALSLGGCAAQQEQTDEVVVNAVTAQEFVEQLTLENRVTVVDDAEQQIIFGTLDADGLEQYGAYCKQVLDTADDAELLDATVSSTLLQQDPMCEMTVISDLEEYLSIHPEIPQTDLTDQNFCYRIEKT